MDYFNNDIDAYLSTPCNELTEFDYLTMVQEYKYQRYKKTIKYATGIIGCGIASSPLLIAGLTGGFADLFMLALSLVGSVLGGVFASVLTVFAGMMFEPEFTRITCGDILTRKQLKALKSKIKEYKNLHRLDKNAVADKTITYEEYKKQQGITDTQTKAIETNAQKHVIVQSNEDDLNSNL